MAEDVEHNDPAAAERAGDEAAAAGRPALALYQNALQRLIAADERGDVTDRMAWMHDYQRVATKINSSSWSGLAGRGRLADAAILLTPQASRTVGMGWYAAHGYKIEALADEAAANGDRRGALVLYWAAVESYLLYSVFPARGDSEHVGYENAERVLAKIEAPGSTAPA
jgi:hypothetical protein